MILWGIDYGSKLAGTTALASVELKLQDSSGPNDPPAPSTAISGALPVNLYSSEKKKDADQFILNRARLESPSILFIDAPLSLPEAYFGGGNDFFYRPVDKEVGAMSPMFLGGLTARAMRLSADLTRDFPEIVVKETYPKLRAKALSLHELNYKKSQGDLLNCFDVFMQAHPNWHLDKVPVNWHEFDALLALSSAMRFYSGTAIAYGEMGSAQIIV